MKNQREMTRQELYESTSRKEREYYEGIRSLKQPIKIPITKDGIETILEMACEALEVPLDDTIREVFCGYIHHLDQNVKHTTMGEVGNVIWKNLSNNATWTLDQECKEKRRKLAEEERAEKAKLELAKEVTPVQGEIHS